MKKNYPGRRPHPIRTPSTTLRVLLEEADRQGWMIKQLALELDVTDQCVSYWRRGRTLPSLTTMEALAAALGCRVTIGTPGGTDGRL